jgi:hypothetical protein
MIEGLESGCKVEKRNFNSIFGTFEGHRIYASREVAEKIEIQTRYAAELYDVDVPRLRYSPTWKPTVKKMQNLFIRSRRMMISNYLMEDRI